MLSLLAIFKVLLYIVGSIQLAFLLSIPKLKVGHTGYLRAMFFGFAVYPYSYLLYYHTSIDFIARIIATSGVIITFYTALFFISLNGLKLNNRWLVLLRFFSLIIFLVTLLTNVYPDPEIVADHFISGVNLFTYIFTLYIIAGFLFIIVNNVVHRAKNHNTRILVYSFLIFAAVAILTDVIVPIIYQDTGPVFLIGPVSSAIFAAVFFYQIHKASELEMSQSLTRFAFVLLCLFALGALFTINTTLALIQYMAFLVLVITAAIVYAIIRNEQHKHQTLQSNHLATVSYLGDIAHRLKTPLAVIDLKAANALDDGNLEKQTLTEIKNIAHTTAVTMKNLVQVSKIDYGFAHLNRSQTDVSQFLRELKPELTALTHRHRLKLQIAPNIWARVDRDRLREALFNLVDNAVKFSPPQSPIVITLSAQNDHLRLTVTDRGSGMDAETKSHLFERHFQSDDGRQHTGSAGLGLAITKWIVEQHGGTIAVESQLGHGTTFTITLPSLSIVEADKASSSKVKREVVKF